MKEQTSMPVNKFCEKSYINRSFFYKYQDLVWIACTTTGTKHGTPTKQATKTYICLNKKT